VKTEEEEGQASEEGHMPLKSHLPVAHWHCLEKRPPHPQAPALLLVFCIGMVSSCYWYGQGTPPLSRMGP
jgi:hypothetical protein